MKEFLKTTIIGGALFLLPVALVLLVLNHALQLAGKVVRPISHNLHFERAVTGVVLPPSSQSCCSSLCRSPQVSSLARILDDWISSWFESSFLGGLPQYQMMKSMGEGLAQIEDAEDLKPALIRD